MLLRCSVLLILCLTAISAQKGGRQASERSPSRIWAARKIPQASEPIEQIAQEADDKDPEEDREVVVAAIPQRPRYLPPPSRPQPAEDDPSGHPAPEPYSFSYSVDDPETGAATSREETQDANGEIVGFYHLRDADGRMRRVDYTAGKDGFKATIKSNEEGLNARAPADVNIELSASPSESRASYAPNDRPVASESSIKGFARPPSERFFQRLIPLPAPIAPAPIAAPPTQETQRIEQVIEQKAEDPPEEAQISQQYETSEPSDPQEIVQQKNVDIEEAFESAPPQPLPPTKGRTIALPSPQVIAQPAPRPVGHLTPSITQSFREQGVISLQPLSLPITQVREQISNTIQEPQPPASTKSIPRLSLPSYQAFRPLSPVINQQQEIVIAPQAPQPMQLAFPYYEPQQQISAQPVSAGYNLLINHREAQLTQTPRQQVITQQRVVEQPLQPLQPLQPIQRIQTQYRSDSQVRQLVPPPAPQPLPQINIQPTAFEYRPLPSPPQSVQREEQRFEPQTYEPIQQTYEPLQQEAEDPAEESRVEPPCKCDDNRSASVAQPVKSSVSAPTEPQPVKSGRLSPARAFIPQAFRSS